MTEDELTMTLHKVLESIDKRLTGIETKLESVIRLEEKVSNHEQVISRYGRRLDESDSRVRTLELWQAEHNPELMITSIKSNRDSIDLIKDEVSDLKIIGNRNRGQKDIVKELLKWVTAILAAWIIYKTTRGM